MEAEQQAVRDQALAETLAGWGIDPNLPDSNVRDEAIYRSRPEKPKAAGRASETRRKGRDGLSHESRHWRELRPGFNQNDMQACMPNIEGSTGSP